VTGFAEGFAEALVRDGARTIFGVPGSGASYALIAGLEARGVAYYGASHEAAAAIMAGAFGRQSDLLGASISIKGPGLANMLPGIASNYFEKLPTLSIAEAVGPLTPSGRVHKRIDQKSLLSGLIKAYATPGDPEETSSRLLSCARAEITGPVHLDLIAGEAPSFTEFPTEAQVTANGDGVWSAVVKLVSRSSKPVLIVGAMARRRAWRERLSRLDIPVFTTLAAKGVIDERRPNAGGVFTGDGKALSPEQRVLPEADLVVGLGLRNFEILKPDAISARHVLIDCVPSESGKGFSPSASYNEATDAEFGEILDLVSRRNWGSDVVAGATTSLRQRLLGHSWLPARLFASMEDRVPNAVFVADTGSFCTIAEHVWRARDPNGFVASANGRYMGTSIPMAIGAALADPARPVICAMGDGGVRMYFAEIKLALQHGLRILFLFISDGRYGSIAGAMPADLRRSSILSMPNPSWFRAALALGCSAESITSLSALDDAVHGWTQSGGPHFIEANFDPEAYLAMTEQLR
jgi:acetolactate synthase-1/2/3 large subunit